MVRTVLLLPDPVLARPCQPVGDLHRGALAVATDLVDTMRATSHCVGLAAPQIGVPLRAFCLDVTGHPKTRSCHGEIVLFDPAVVASSGREVAREGCMSVPDLTGDVARPARVCLEGIGPNGEARRLELDGFEARAALHELDHLDGRLFLDQVVADDRVFRRRVYR